MFYRSAARGFIFAIVMAALPSCVLAANTPEQIVESLRNDGYHTIYTHQTLLGRIRIRASGDGKEREIILHRGTGDVLRDVIWQTLVSRSQNMQETADPLGTMEPGFDDEEFEVYDMFEDDDWFIPTEGEDFFVCEGAECEELDYGFPEELADDFTDDDIMDDDLPDDAHEDLEE